ncbi:MAG: efflux RND transporter periplasmic adaptor subunit [Cyclobacteriaceae bacterium]|nr:efflux RND transporter periplasmic adaptor subunit [Cyclobacteriaceae bacterium]
MKKKVIIASSIVIVLFSAYIFQKINSKGSDGSEVIAKVQKGYFRVEVTTSGELDAKNSVEIMGPNGLRRAHIYQVKIDDIVDEGTVVEKGGYIARLDQSEIGDKIQNEETDLKQTLSQYTQARLDTALELRKARDELINLKYDIEEKGIILDQSQFEPPAEIKKAEINVEKANRAYHQAVENYKLQKEKAVAEVDEASAKMMDDKNQLNFLKELSKEFTVLAPEQGMVIYNRNWRGQKQGVGATISPWDPTVAKLPDLSKMVSKTYINEVDINTVKVDQRVEIGLDAFPDIKLTGIVIEVANVGEQKPNTDSKVFQLLIEIHESDTTLRPGMTTSNTIVSGEFADVLFVPVESLHSQGDSLSFVYKKEGLGIAKQEVLLGRSNADEVVVLKGLEENDLVYLSDPDGLADKKIERLEASLEQLTDQQ